MSQVVLDCPGIVSIISQQESTLKMPFTVGEWQDCDPVMLTLNEGENILRFSRSNPPQYGLAVKSFALRPVR